MPSALRSLRRILPAAAALVFAAAIAAPPAPAPAAGALPRPRHVVVIVEENRSFAEIVGNGRAPFINRLAKGAAVFSNAHGVTHPSLPNYLALFAGLTNDNGDGCPATGIAPTAPNLASQLLAARYTFAGFSEALPAAGSRVCAAGTYARKHAPWVAFANVPASANRPLSALPRFAALPTVAFIVPDVDDDMHDGTIAQGDTWLATHLGPLISWSMTHDTLVVLTWDEGYDSGNTIPTLFYGPMVRPGSYATRITHYNVLRTLEDLYALPHAGHAAAVASIADCWR